MQNGTATLEDNLAVYYKANKALPHDPTIVLLGIYPNELETYVHTKPCTQMFIAGLFIIDKIESKQDVLQQMSG